MCLSLPGRVVAVDLPAALVDVGGTRRWYNALTETGLRPGERVLVHAGFILRRLPEQEAIQIEEALAELDRISAADAPDHDPERQQP